MAIHPVIQGLRRPFRFPSLYALLAVLCSTFLGYGGETATVQPAAGGSRPVHPKASPNILCRPDIIYCRLEKSDLQLDLFLPAKGQGPFPAVLLFHGGGVFNRGRKALAPFAEQLARKGYVAAAVSYRCQPEHAFPAPVHDG